MDFSATDLFVEIFVAGALLVFSVSPILICFSQRAQGHDGLLPWANDRRDWKPWLVLAIALTYSVGIAGNRLIEKAYKSLCLDSIADSGETELAVRDHGEIARDFVERHKTYRKVLRAASFSSFLFLVSMIFHRVYFWLRRLRYQRYFAGRLRHQRYFWQHYAPAVLLLLFFSGAFHVENNHYGKVLAY